MSIIFVPFPAGSDLQAMNAFLSDFRDGVSSYVRAFEFLREHRLWFFLVLPGLLSIVFGTLVILAAWGWSDDLARRIIEWYPWDRAREVVERIAAILSGLLIVALAVILYKYVILIIVAPFMSYLSEKVENIVIGRSEGLAFSISGAISDIVRGVRIALRNIIRELFFTMLLFLFGFVPLIGVLSAPGILAVQAYYAGFGSLDFTLERHFGVRGSVRFVRQYKGLAVGNGLIFLLLLTVPLLGLFVAPALGTIAGALESVDRLEVSERAAADAV